MQFFTPQLYEQFNSLDDAEAERANEAWDQAILAYKRHLETIRERMPSQVVALSELCLHDAEVLKREEIVQASGPPFYHDFPYPFPPLVWSAVEVITLRLDEEIVLLFYCLWDRVQIREPPDAWHFSKLGEHWLYDEIRDHGDRRSQLYTHSIFLSTGIVLDIPFMSVVIHRFPVPQSDARHGRKTA